MTPSESEKNTTITIPSELAERIRRRADAQGKLRRQVVREAIDALESLETQHVIMHAPCGVCNDKQPEIV